MSVTHEFHDDRTHRPYWPADVCGFEWGNDVRHKCWKEPMHEFYCQCGLDCGIMLTPDYHVKRNRRRIPPSGMG